MSSDIPNQGGVGVLKHDNVIRRVAAHSLEQMLENGVGLLCVPACVCIKERDRRIAEAITGFDSAEGFSKHIHPVFAAVHTNSLIKLLEQPLSHSATC